MNTKRHLWILLFVLAALISVPAAFSTPAARAGDGHDEKVDKRLAAIAATLGDDVELNVIVLGSDAENAGKKFGEHKKRLGLVGGAASKIKVKDLMKLAAEDGVASITLDPPVAPQGVVDYSQIVTSYPFSDRTKVAWDSGYDGRGVGVAVIDSGVAPVSEFGTRLVQVTPATQTWASTDAHGHGTLVASIAAGKSPDGRFVGAAPGASVYALNVNNPAGMRASDVIDALQWVHENAQARNIRVVNLSLAETVASSYTQSTLDLAVERVWAAGIVVVASAGNGGVGLVDFAPANDPLAITVGSIDDRGTRAVLDDTIAPFSSNGATLDGFAKPELVAPGRLIAGRLAAGTVLDAQAPAANRIAPGYATISGTSFSAPQVAGAAAILLQQHPDWSPDQVKGTLVKKGRLVVGSLAPALSLAFVDNLLVAPTAANQGVPALVCAPGSLCLPGTTIASLWNSSSWNSSSWNSSSWNSSSWNSSSWNSSSWNSSSWNSSSWNSSSWNSSSWNSSSWNSSSWNAYWG